MREVLDFYAEKINQSNVLDRMDLTPNGYFLVSVHREENVDTPDNLRKIFAMLNALVAKYQLPVIVSTHPRTRKRIEALGLEASDKVIFNKPFGFLDYVKLQIHAKVVLSDSGTITEESSILNFPALNIRESHERPEGFEEGAVMMTGLDTQRILAGVEILSEQSRGTQRQVSLVTDYATQNVSDKVLKIIVSYTDYIDHKTWKKPAKSV